MKNMSWKGEERKIDTEEISNEDYQRIQCSVVREQEKNERNT